MTANTIADADVTESEVVDLARLQELVDRMTFTSGPIAGALSASEWHELREEVTLLVQRAQVRGVLSANNQTLMRINQQTHESTFRALATAFEDLREENRVLRQAKSPVTKDDGDRGTPTGALPSSINAFNTLVRELHAGIADGATLTEANLDTAKVLESFATGGPWQLWTSNSYRRIGTERGDGDVISGSAQRDGQGDLTGANIHADLMYAVAARTLLPRAILTIRQMGRDMHDIAEADELARHQHEQAAAKEFGRLRGELKEAKEILASRDDDLQRAAEHAVEVEANVHALGLENAKLRKMRDALVIALAEANDGR